MSHRALRALVGRLADFVVRFADCFGRESQHDALRRYIEGALSDAPRKSMQGIWERTRDAGDYQALQHFITHSPWEPRDLWKVLRETIPERKGVLIIDDTGFPKQGKHSVGVKRQYSGTLGKVGNCQVAVTTVLRTSRSTWPNDIELYLPEDWTSDQERRESAGIPTVVRFRRKWEIALGQVAKARRAGLQIECVCADAGYGDTTEFRRRLDRMHLRYAVGVSSTTSVFTEPPQFKPRSYPGRGRPRSRPRMKAKSPRSQSVANVAAGLPSSTWKQVTWRKGSKGNLSGTFAALRVTPGHRWYKRFEEKPCWLLIEKVDEDSFKFYLSNLPDDIPLKRLVFYPKERWAIEQNYQELKGALGLDHFQGRSYMGWHRHVLLIAIAFTFLALEGYRKTRTPLPTLPTVKRIVTEILSARVMATRHDLVDAILYWRSRPPPDQEK